MSDPFSEASASSAASTASTFALPGRVIRLHFTCHAELPIGSTLRVTGSTLWAPGAAALDPSEAGAAYVHEQAEGFPVNTQSPESIMDESMESTAATSSLMNGRPLYASSIEMVTTPETYPVWKTRRPVIIVSHATQQQSNNTTQSTSTSAPPRRRIQHHYYRYLVVCPGAAADDDTRGGESILNDQDSSPIISTSNEEIGSTPVMQWEDPFSSILQSTRNNSTASNMDNTPRSATMGEVSMTSMTSSHFGTTSSATLGIASASAKDYRNLPYRTLDIDLVTGQPLWDDAVATTIGEDSVAATTTLNEHMDHWNSPDDATFRPYRIRDVVS
jgi:hypothetical protein